MNFKESLMSVTPNDLPKRTRVLVKDLLFQEKHLLTNTQIDLMSYIFNAFTWAVKINGYIALTNKKFSDDLPQIREKTLESSLQELESKGLIEREGIRVPQWRNAKVRGIKITFAGMKYNSSLYTPTHQAIVNALQTRIEELENSKEKAIQPNQLKDEFEPKNEEKSQQILEPLIPINEPLEAKKEIKNEIKVETPNQEQTLVKETIEVKATNEKKELVIYTHTHRDKTLSFSDFVSQTKKRFALAGEPISNMVDGWKKESTFYINSFGQLACTTPLDKKCGQIKNPVEVNKFWRWLFNHQDRVGKLIDLGKIDEIIVELNKKYKDKEIKLGGKRIWIEEICSKNEGLIIKIRNKHQNITIITNKGKQPILYSFSAVEKFIDKVKI